MAVQVHTLLEETSIQWHSIRDEFPPEAYGIGERRVKFKFQKLLDCHVSL